MEENLNKPKYRLRLFLSVDLTGSTDFKSKDGINSLVWLKAFQKFYGEFPSIFIKQYSLICEQTHDVDDSEASLTPKVWKTIGDEILFVNRVHSLTQLGAYVSAFTEALKTFGSDIKGTYNLNTKGNGWIAAFPNPNCSIQISHNGDGDPLSGNNDVLTEEFELKVDENPQLYDFLGKGIDSGFRISKNSTVDTFTVSPALAYLLCRAQRNSETTCFDCDFQFHEPQKFKGVVGGAYYPIVSIDTSRDERIKEMISLQSSLLKQPSTKADVGELFFYLGKYINYHGIEPPELKLSHGAKDIEPPQHYLDYIREWDAEVAKINSQDEGIMAASLQDESDDQSMSPSDFIKMFTKVISEIPINSEDDPGDDDNGEKDQ